MFDVWEYDLKVAEDSDQYDNFRENDFNINFEIDDLEKIKQIFKSKKIDVNASNNGGRTLLHLAAMAGRLDVVEWLIENRADITRRTGIRGRVPLHYAASNGHLGVVECLVEWGAAIDEEAQDENNGTPLAYAMQSVFNRYNPVAGWLIDHGANIYHKSVYDFFNTCPLNKKLYLSMIEGLYPYLIKYLRPRQEESLIRSGFNAMLKNLALKNYAKRMAIDYTALMEYFQHTPAILKENTDPYFNVWRQLSISSLPFEIKVKIAGLVIGSVEPTEKEVGCAAKKLKNKEKECEVHSVTTGIPSAVSTPHDSFQQAEGSSADRALMLSQFQIHAISSVDREDLRSSSLAANAKKE